MLKEITCASPIMLTLQLVWNVTPERATTYMLFLYVCLFVVLGPIDATKFVEHLTCFT